MSKLYDPSTDHRNYWAIGSTVLFDHDGERLRGTIVRAYSNCQNFHVEVNGQRYETQINDDNMEMVWE